MSVNIGSKTLITPPTRIPWPTVYADIRSAIGQNSAAAISDQTIVEAVDRAVQTVWPKQWVHSQWSAQLVASTVTAVGLPFAIEQVLSCQWASVDGTVPGTAIPDLLYEVDGATWHWLGTTNDWPSYDWYLSLDVLYRAQTSTVDSAGCTVPLQYLRQLTIAELMPTLATQAGQPLSDAIMNAQRLRQQTMQMLPAVRTPARKPHTHNTNVNTLPFVFWASTTLTWGDFE